jgi:hypothetical protein
MSLAQNIARKALADFFAAAEVQRAHWYSIKEAKDGACCHDVNLVFPSLSSLLSINKDILTAVKEIAALLYKRKAVSSSLLRACEELLREYKLTNELTTFSILGKQRVFIRVGSWSQRHLAITPKAIWCSRDSYDKPILWISTLSMEFAPTIWNFKAHCCIFCCLCKERNGL